MPRVSRIILLFMTLFNGVLSAKMIEIQHPLGDPIILDYYEKTQGICLKLMIEQLTHIPTENQLLMIENREVKDDDIIYLEENQVVRLEEKNHFYPKKTYPGYRNYYAETSSSEKKDLRYILKSLAQKSLPSLLGVKSYLEQAGNRIDHLHPLKFLECVFTDQELIVFIRNIKKRGSFVWNEFSKGIKESLQDEFQIGNMKEEYLKSFSNCIDVNLGIFNELVISQKWDDFIKTLISHVPRKGETDRYNQ